MKSLSRAAVALAASAALVGGSASAASAAPVTTFWGGGGTHSAWGGSGGGGLLGGVLSIPGQLVKMCINLCGSIFGYSVGDSWETPVKPSNPGTTNPSPSTPKS